MIALPENEKRVVLGLERAQESMATPFSYRRRPCIIVSVILLLLQEI